MIDVEGVRPVLLERKEALESELGSLTETPRDPMGSVSFGKRVGEGTNQAVERIAQTSAARSLWTKLQDVERALAKLDEGTYGVCDSCGQPIEPARLEAIASATYCFRCASERASR